MPKFIFSNSSYLVSFNTPENIKSINTALAKEKKFKVAEVADIDEFLDTIDRVKYFIDIYIFLEGIDQDSLNILFNALGPLKLDFILFNPSKDLDILFAAKIGLDLNFIILNFFTLLIVHLHFYTFIIKH